MGNGKGPAEEREQMEINRQKDLGLGGEKGKAKMGREGEQPKHQLD